MHIHVNILTTTVRVCILKFDIVAMHLRKWLPDIHEQTARFSSGEKFLAANGVKNKQKKLIWR